MSIDSYNQPPSIFEEVRPSIPNESPDIKPDLVAVVPPSSSDNSDSDSDTDSEYSDDKMQSIQEAVAVSKMQNNKNNSTVKPTKKEKPSKLPITKATHSSSSSSSSSSKPSLRSRSSSAVNYNFLNNNISLPSTPLVTSSAPLFVASQSPYKVNVEEGSLSKLWITDASGYSNLTQPLRCMTQFRNVDQKVLVAGSNTGTIEVYDLDVGKGMIKFQTNYIINNDSNAFVDDVDLDCTEQYCIATIRAKQGFTAKSSFIMVDVKESKVILQPFIEAHRKPMVTCKFLSTGMNFVSVSKDNSFLWVRDVDQSLSSGCSFLPHPISNKNLTDVYNPINSDYLYLLSADGTIESFSIKEKRQEFEIDNVNKNLRTTGFATMINPSSCNQNTLLYGYTNMKAHSQSLEIFDIKSQKVVYSAHSMEEKLSEFIVPSWHPSGNIISCGSASGMIYFYDVRMGDSNMPIGKYKLKSRVNRANFYPDSDHKFIFTLCSSHPRLCVLKYTL